MAKVLIVEDDVTIRVGIVRALTGRGHVVVSAGTAMEGLKLALAEKPDVLLVSTLDRALTGVIEHTRSPSAVPTRVDLARVVTERCAFWAVLAEDQGRAMDVTVPPSGVLVGAAPATVAACVDALVGNVFAHTPDGSGFSVVLVGPVLTVSDSGPGFPSGDVVRRGVSRGGSSGLGLDIVRQVASSVTVGRSPAGGAEVTVVFLTEP